MDNFDKHEEALIKTGFWGRQGAGCVILASQTGRLLVARRSEAVLEPGTWGTWGGAIDDGETPLDAVKREVEEELGYNFDTLELPNFIPLYVYKSNSFAYHNFLMIIKNEFKPDLGWETDDYKWCQYGDWPSPLHFGLTSLLNDTDSVEMIRKSMIQSINLGEPGV